MSCRMFIAPLLTLLTTLCSFSADLTMTDTPSGSFKLVSKAQATAILVDPADAQTVHVAADMLANDIELVSGTKPNVMNKTTGKRFVVAGTLRSRHIKSLVASGKLDVSSLRGKWETCLIKRIKHPFPGVHDALVVAGSDRRGTAYGLLEISRAIGVSPWVWWADVMPATHKDLYLTLKSVQLGPPSVKYRGIFLNDEDWGLKPWAAKNIDTDIKDIGPKTYARIFELLLRLRGNFIWPAMHPCTKAYYYYKDNPKVADKYGIVIGGSHCEPMLRNNVDEWKKNFRKEYGKRPGPWRYDTNKDEIHKYWEDRVVESKNYESVYTVGMRGIHDGSMPGPRTTEAKIDLMHNVLADQRAMFKTHIGDAKGVPQIFCPYKEVLHLYRSGMTLPEDITLVWADDNHGFIRQLSTPTEQKRSGGSGVYYHLSYWGAPEDYLWLSSISPSLVSYEMSKAYAFGADRLWVFNVGDIKPAELETQFALDLAWDVQRWQPKTAHRYVEHWATTTFGPRVAKPIAEIKSIYYRLAAAGKPEHINRVKFSSLQMTQRLAAYAKAAAKAKELEARIPARLKDAYFQLISYPLLGAWKLNEVHFMAKQGKGTEAKAAYDEIRRLTTMYNKTIAKGKWNGIMSCNPRNRPVFKMPKIMPIQPESKQQTVDGVLAANQFTKKHDSSKRRIITIDGLGKTGHGISVKPFTAPSLKDNEVLNAPWVEYQVELPKGKRAIYVQCLPTHAIHDGRGLRYGISVNGDKPQIRNVHTPSKTKPWKGNVIRGYSQGKSTHTVQVAGKSTIRIYLLDTGLVLLGLNTN